MNQKIIKLIRKFIHYSSGTKKDVDRVKDEVKKMNWLQKTKEFARMREILQNAV